jgi:aspartyl-tRNA(Asn)/glutamyl-tRNA(Gln) amidotransferase subunit A
MVIGKPREYFPPELDRQVAHACDRAFERMVDAGATVKEISLPHTALAIPVYYIIAPAEASSNLARFDGVRYGFRVEGDGLRAMYEATRSRGFGAEVTRRILLGTYVLSAGYYDAYYRKAQEVRTLITEDFRSAFDDGVDAIFTPTTPTPAFPIGSKTSDPYEMYLNDIFTATVNLAGVPAISVPIGRVDGLPIGGQFITRHFEEQTMFAAAFALERLLGEEAHR